MRKKVYNIFCFFSLPLFPPLPPPPPFTVYAPTSTSLTSPAHRNPPHSIYTRPVGRVHARACVLYVGFTRRVYITTYHGLWARRPNLLTDCRHHCCKCHRRRRRRRHHHHHFLMQAAGHVGHANVTLRFERFVYQRTMCVCHAGSCCGHRQ